MLMRTKKYTDEQFIEAVKEHSPASTSEVAESVGCTRPSADGRLKGLVEEGEIHRKKIGKVQVWYTQCK